MFGVRSSGSRGLKQDQGNQSIQLKLAVGQDGLSPVAAGLPFLEQG